jgi:hypothetical protein
VTRARPYAATLAAVAVVMLWFAVQLAQFLGDPPDLDAMVGLREALIVKRGGFDALIDQAAAGIHPPLLELLSSAFFTVFGEDNRSQNLIAIVLFVAMAAGTERLLAQWLSPVPRVVAALIVAMCPAIAVAVFLVSREGLMIGLLVPALALTVAPDPGRWRWLGLGLLLALLPLIKETGLLVTFPFAVYAAFAGPAQWRARALRFAAVLGPVVVVTIGWRLVLSGMGGKPWESWLLTDHADDGAYVLGIRAMLGMEDGIFFRQNLANGLIVNWLWLPAVLALVGVVLAARRSTPSPLRRAIALVFGAGFVYAWTTLGFPTYTIPRYATPVSLLVILCALLGLALWPRVLRPVGLAVLVIAFALGAWGPTDPVSRHFFHTTKVYGEKIYDTALEQRGPDRMVINLAMLRATHRLDARLKRLFASDAALATGDCFTLKAGEKLYSIGLAPDAYARALPGARNLPCVTVDQLPPDAAGGPNRIAVLRSPEEEAANVPPVLEGPSVFVVR